MNKCPDCGKKGLPIVYGLPSTKLFERAKEGKVILGGCMIYPDNPHNYCPDCEVKW